MKNAAIVLLLIVAAASTAMAENAGQYDAAALVVRSTRGGNWQGFVRYAPKPNVHRTDLRQHLPAHGVYVVDIGTGGAVDDVRILHSSGDKVIDDATVAALRQWTFIRHTIYKATIGFDFGVPPRSQ